MIYKKQYLVILITVIIILSEPIFSADGKSMYISEKTGWSEYLHDSRHRGRSEFNTSSNTGDVLWKRKVDSWATDGGLISYGRYVFVHTGRKLITLDGATGKVLWNVSFSSRIVSVAVKNYTIYVSDAGGNISALDFNGRCKWFVYEPIMDGVLVTVSEGIIVWDYWVEDIYYLSSNGSVKRIGNFNSVYPLPAFSNDTLYAPIRNQTDKTGSIYALDIYGGMKWTFEINEIIDFVAVGDDGTVYVLTTLPPFLSSTVDKLYAIDSSGNLKWSFELDVWYGMHWADKLMIGKNAIYITNAGRPSNPRPHIIKLGIDGHKPKLLWEKVYENITGGIDEILIDSSENIYFREGYYLYSLSPEGVLRWKIKIGRDTKSGNRFINSFIIGKNGVIYLLNLNGTLYAIGSKKQDEILLTIVLSSVILVVASSVIILWRRIVKSGK